MNENLFHLPSLPIPPNSVTMLTRPMARMKLVLKKYFKECKNFLMEWISSVLWYSVFSFAPVKSVHETLIATALKKWKLYSELLVALCYHKMSFQQIPLIREDVDCARTEQDT